MLAVVFSVARSSRLSRDLHTQARDEREYEVMCFSTLLWEVKVLLKHNQRIVPEQEANAPTAYFKAQIRMHASCD
ncbi:hypothetical protein TMatcc_007794 [Talaromyces marneffei ATCC 18224]|uniref:uncharacterized protein n=1 Tax=Talaromyces marneffei TaxID=37727 RepID=UPI0012A9ED65|nr:uncharacterized protein EYB26_004718 [Talaromyces marneffei]QGA17048.1 hypothetical protein EYB26_004718 [Talaromyces marneffei]